MGFLLFALSMAALALMSTTKESRATAKQEYLHLKPLFDKIGAFLFVLAGSFFF